MKMRQLLKKEFIESISRNYIFSSFGIDVGSKIIESTT